MFSGCLDEQYSVDSYDGYAAGGAMTTAFVRSVETLPLPTYPELITAIAAHIKRQGHKQRPQVSSSQAFDLGSRVFTLDNQVLYLHTVYCTHYCTRCVHAR
jgi:hypothetical protein